MSTTPAKGRADFLELGSWNALCAQCGRKRKQEDMRQLPPGVPGSGMYVCFPEHWDNRQPQDFVRGVPDKMAAPWVQKPSDGYTLIDIPIEEDDTYVFDTDTSGNLLVTNGGSTTYALGGATTLIIFIREEITASINLLDLSSPITDVVINVQGILGTYIAPSDSNVTVQTNQMHS